MSSANVSGALMVGLPLMLVAYALLWQRLRSVFWFALALIAVATGYLMATGATDDIARWLVP
jgi:hypothetical protein